jgi:hypothetical protein
MFQARELFKESKFRRSAAACGLFAANATSLLDRELLLRMQRSLLERAYNEDWLGGLPPIPPAKSNALAVPSRRAT